MIADPDGGLDFYTRSVIIFICMDGDRHRELYLSAHSRMKRELKKLDLNEVLRSDMSGEGSSDYSGASVGVLRT